jgi:cytochrome c peroxidase
MKTSRARPRGRHTLKNPKHAKFLVSAATIFLIAHPGNAQQGPPTGPVGSFPLDRPPINGTLTGTPVPLPDLTGFVADKTAAITLGKALFWEQQAGSDGLACGSCHFHAGADHRVKNQIDPGLRHTNPALQNTFDPMGSGKKGPNNTLTLADYPFHKLADINERNSQVLFDTNDITSSQGVFRGDFGTITLQAAAGRSESCTPALSPTFSVGGINVRQVEPRNTPTMINAIFNVRNFWDSRANNIFNGRNPFGRRDPSAGIDPFNSVMVTDALGNMSPMTVALPDSSLASQAVGPPGSNLEMSCNNRTFEAIGQKLLQRNAATGVAVTVPLSGQTVAPTDSVLGPYAGKPGKGLTVSYESLIKQAFLPKFWNATAPTGEGYRQIEKNFPLFWGLSIMLYESTLVSDNAPFDRYMNGDITAMTTQQVTGFLQVFVGKGGCNFCHSGAAFTGAAAELKILTQIGAGVEYMHMGDGTVGLYDSSSYNIGVRPTSEDIGTGGTDPWGNPLSWSRQAKNAAAASGQSLSSMIGISPDLFNVFTCNFVVTPCTPVTGDTRDVVDGSFKVPSLRNVELTGPYFHNGGQATLEQVVAFYNRGGDGAGTDFANTTGFGANPTNRDPNIFPLHLTADDQANLVAFLKALTDDRVRWEKAPFDHPSLTVPNGHAFNETSVLRNGATAYAMDSLMTIPAVGAAGRAAANLPPLGPFEAGLK